MQCLSTQKGSEFLTDAGICGCITLYLLAFLLTEFSINVRTQLLFGDSAVNIIYAVGLLCTAAGYALLPLVHKLFSGSRFLRYDAVCAGLLCLLFSALMQLVDGGFLACAAAALVLFGYIGAMVHYRAAVLLNGSGHIGRVVGSAIAAATLVQFAIQELVRSAHVVLAFIWLFSALTAALLCMKKNSGGENPKHEQGEKPPQDIKKQLLIAGTAVVLMTLLFALNDGVATLLHAQGVVNIVAVPRLLYALGAFAAGAIADIRRRELMPLVTVCALMLSMVASAFLSGPELYNYNLCALYLYGGFYVVYLSVSFMSAAPATDNPMLWSGMGRILRSLSSALIVIPAPMLYSRFGQPAFTIIGFLISASVLLLFFFGGSLSPEQTPAVETASEYDRLQSFAETHGLTPRETEALGEVVDNDRCLKQIAFEMGISERVLQKHMTHIYEKTGAQSRIGLSLMYFGRYNDKH